MIGWCHTLSGTKDWMDWMGLPTLRYQGNVDGPWYLSFPGEGEWPESGLSQPIRLGAGRRRNRFRPMVRR